MPKSTTLDDLEGPLRTVFKTRASFGDQHEYLNEDRPIDEDVPNDSTFWQYKVYADIRGGSRDFSKFSLDKRMPAYVWYTVLDFKFKSMVYII